MFIRSFTMLFAFLALCAANGVGALAESKSKIILAPACGCCDYSNAKEKCTPKCWETVCRKSSSSVRGKVQSGVENFSQTTCDVQKITESQQQDIDRQIDRFDRSHGLDSCDMATAELMSLRGDIVGKLETKGQLTDAEANTVKAYAGKCLVEPRLLFESNLTKDEKADLTARLSYIEAANGVSFCNGLRIGHHVITALHCLREERSNIPKASSYRVYVQGAAKSYDSVEVELASNRSINPWDQSAKDYAILRLNVVPGEFRNDKFPLGSPVLGRKFVTVNSNLYKQVLNGQRNGIVLENRVFCTNRAMSPTGLFYHSCQTEEGTSGAPMLQRDDYGRIRLVGVHRGGNAESFACSGSAANMGVAVPVVELQRLIDQVP